MIDWKRKLTSRKFWVAVVGLVTGIMLLFGVDADRTEKIGGIILTAGSIVAYILGEGMADANGGDVVIETEGKIDLIGDEVTDDGK